MFQKKDLFGFQTLFFCSFGAEVGRTFNVDIVGFFGPAIESVINKIKRFCSDSSLIMYH